MNFLFSPFKSGWMWLVVAICYLSIPLHAAPILGKEFSFKQPDGTMVQVKVYGDEYYQRVESLDGYTLVRDEQGWISYAQLSADGSQLISTGVVYRGGVQPASKQIGATVPTQKGIRLGKAAVLKQRELALSKLPKSPRGAKKGSQQRLEDAPIVGAVKGLAVLIDFSDEPAFITKAAIDNYFNQIGYSDFGNNGSIRDFYKEVSSNNLDYTNAVVGYYRAKKPKSYYDDTTYFGHTGELLQEVYEWLDAQNFDWTILSTEGGTIRAINVFYAGNPASGWSKGLWPHASGYYYVTKSGLATGSYQMTNISNALSIRTTCHENGHMLMKWPDLYDYDYDATGVGNYCLMGYGANDWNPVPPNPYFRARVGWETHTVVSGGATNYTLTANAYTALRYQNPTLSTEFFQFENKLKTGRNTYLPGEGLLVWHIDENGNNSANQMTPTSHYLVSVEQADGLFQLENNQSYGKPEDFFKAGYKTTFNDQTNPSAKWWSGANSDLLVSNVGAVGASLSVTIGSAGTIVAPTSLEATQFSANSVALRWIDNATNEQAYKIERKVGSGTFTLLTTLAANVTSYTDGSLTLNNVYTYRVTATSGTNASPTSNEAIVKVKSFANLALSKPTTTSSTQSASYPGANAVDGNASTRWTSAISDPQWIYVDLGQNYLINRVKIVWEAAGKNFKVQVSNNATAWTDVVTATNNASLTNDYPIFATQGRYVRISGTTRIVTTKGYSIYTLEVYGTTNTPPTVAAPSVSGSPDGVAPWTATLNTTASDADGSIAKVEYYQGTQLIGTSTSAPYSVTWSNITAGTYSVTAKAYDDNGVSTTSAITTVRVKAAPQVTVTSPVNNAVFNSPANVILGATATDSDGSIAKVEFFKDYGRYAVKLGEDLTSPYSYTWTGLAPGTYYATARATDNDGVVTEAAYVTFTVRGPNTPPTISIVAPASNAHFTAPATFEIGTNPTDQEGPISKVEFFQDGVKIGEDLFYPGFSWTVSNLAAGTYTFTAKAFDGDGASTLSAPITVVVDPPVTTCVLTEATPLSTQWVLRNDWNDQNAGSNLSNESGALKVIHRAYGQNLLWVIDNTQFPLVNGQVYNLKFDFKDFAGYTINGIEVGLASSVGSAGPTLTQSVIVVPAGYSSAAFTTKSVNFTATSTQNVRLALKLKWTSQPTTQVTDYIKNIQICKGAVSPARSEEELSQSESLGAEWVISPNPADNQLYLTGNFDGALEWEIHDLSGAKVVSQQMDLTAATTGLRLDIHNLSQGMYTLLVKTNGKRWAKNFVKQ